MFGVFAVFLICTCYQVIKEVCTPTIPAENWANKELYHQDLMSGMSVEQCMQNVQNGKYKLTEKHPEPHRDSKSGKIIIENYDLYKEDVMNYGAYQAYKWLHQGKYNLTSEEAKKQKEEFKKKMDYLYGLL